MRDGPDEVLSEARASLFAHFSTLLARAESPAETADELESRLRAVYADLFTLDFTLFDVPSAADGPRLMSEIFEARLRLREKIRYWHAKGLMTHPVQAALRDVFRILRYAVDMLGETRIGFERRAPDEPAARAFTGTDFNTQVHPNFTGQGNIAFQPGDVLVVRGRAYNSAAIARIGDVDTQFSHTGIVHIDADGRHWMVESLIEEGAIISPLEEVLHHNIGRAVLYRYEDAALAGRAAHLIYDRIAKTSQNWWSRRILYDFTMRLKGTRTLFCSKLVRLAFLEASKGKVVLPPYPTRLDMKNRDFFDGIGVLAQETYAPGDIDLDPAFKLVAEWQDFRVTPDLRLQDMAMTKMFAWMDGFGARFKPDWLIHMIGVFGRFSSRFSERIKELLSNVVPKVPSNMSRRCIGTIAMLHKTGEVLMPPLRELEASRIRMTGRPLHPRDALLHLERLREVAGGRLGYLMWLPSKPSKLAHVRPR